MTIRGSAVLLALLPLPAVAGQPSFDCRSFTGPAEKAICASPELSALDVGIADAYGRVRAGLSATGRDVLRKHQRIFLGVRDRAATRRDDDLGARLADQLAFLRAVDTRPRHGVVGAWRNAIGTVTVTRTDGRDTVEISTAEPVDARWLCNVGGPLENGVGGAVLPVDPAFGEGWSVRLVPHEGVLTVATVPPKPGDGLPVAPFCGHSGSIDGDYLPVLE